MGGCRRQGRPPVGPRQRLVRSAGIRQQGCAAAPRVRTLTLYTLAGSVRRRSVRTVFVGMAHTDPPPPAPPEGTCLMSSCLPIAWPPAACAPARTPPTRLRWSPCAWAATATSSACSPPPTLRSSTSGGRAVCTPGCQQAGCRGAGGGLPADAPRARGAAGGTGGCSRRTRATAQQAPQAWSARMVGCRAWRAQSWAACLLAPAAPPSPAISPNGRAPPAAPQARLPHVPSHGGSHHRQLSAGVCHPGRDAAQRAPHGRTAEVGLGTGGGSVGCWLGSPDICEGCRKGAGRVAAEREPHGQAATPGLSGGACG